jgi:hypothetical protein
MELLISALGSIAISTPIIIVLLIGIALALLRWRRHPRVSLLTLIASAVMIVSMIGAIFLYAWMPMTMRDRGWTSSQLGAFFAAVRIVNTLVDAAAWSMVLCAIFGWRSQRQKQDFFPPAPPTFGNEPREQRASPGFQQ